MVLERFFLHHVSHDRGLVFCVLCMSPIHGWKGLRAKVTAAQEEQVLESLHAPSGYIGK